MFKFLLLFFLIAVTAHWYIWWLAVRVFSISQTKHKVILAILSVLFFGLFVLIMSLSRSTESEVVRWLYVAVMMMQGIFWQLVVWAVISLPLYAILRVIGLNCRAQHFGWVVVAIVVITSLYGIWSAHFGLYVKTIDLDMERLPAEWRGKKAVQISDVHIGVVNRKSYVQKVVDMVKVENPDYVFVTGDLFDSSGNGLSESLEPFQQLNPPGGVYAVIGNHETYHGKDDAVVRMKLLGWKILMDEVVDLEGGVSLVGLDYPEQINRIDISSKLKEVMGEHDDGFEILLYHEPVGLKAADEAGIDLMLSGHTHKGQLWPFRIFTWFIYRGHDGGLSRVGNLWQYTNSATGTWGPYIKSTARPEITLFQFK